MVRRARPKFCLDNSSVTAIWIELKISGNVFRVPSFAYDKNFDHTHYAVSRAFPKFYLDNSS